MAALTVRVVGVPVPQGSKRIGRHPRTGHPMLIDDNGARLRAWRGQIRKAATAARLGRPPLSGPVGVLAVFDLPRPARPRFDVPAVRPDLDKLARAALDALTDAEVWGDDGQVVELRLQKRYATGDRPPGLTLAVLLRSEQQSLD